jgi:diaminohydroxyphosphoribosylaminopyrimidine deaminase/5-amino-6-(5-phosphoribosylamino)uracil reductase
MPFVTAKIAMSMNGKIAKKNGQSLQITGFELSQKTHSHRKMSDAILTTAETILKDDPQLNVRIDGQTYKKPIYILDRKLKLGEDAQIFTTASSITIFHASTETPPSNNNSIRYIPISTTHDGLNLNIAIQHIGKDGIHDLWVEAGGKCFSALIEAKLVNKAFIYIAPCWIVDGKTAFNKLNLQDLQDKNLQWQPCGKDVFCEIHW